MCAAHTWPVYAEAYCSKDIDRLMALFDDGDDISLIGTGADELCAGPADIKAASVALLCDFPVRLIPRNFRHSRGAS
ncbi:MAG: nuclear transport factor 2 family protein [Gemmatimonadetes bacterium]|nr:nuclear transport factor 2 family protein [Gemmatimonadota bacterium]